MSNEGPLIQEIERYLARHAISRAQFASQIGLASSTVEKVLSGSLKPSARFKAKLAEKAGIVISDAPRPVFEFQLPTYLRKDVTHLEGAYQTIRPSYRTDGALNGYLTHIEWCPTFQCLTFNEEGNELSPQNTGYVSVPIFNRMLYLLTCDKGNFRLAILSDAYEAGVYYGGLLTVSSRRMVEKMPTAAVYVLKRLAPGDKGALGLIPNSHPRFNEFKLLVDFANGEGFFRSLAFNS